MSSIEIGLTISVVIVVALFARLNLNPTMREVTKMRSVAELKREIESLRAAADALSEQNSQLRTRLQLAESDRQNLEITLAALRGEMGRTTNGRKN